MTRNDHATIARAMDAIVAAAGRIAKSRTMPENWKIDASRLQVDIADLRRDHSIDHRSHTTIVLHEKE